MLFKISRDIERRRASPDMDLYDYVVAADDDGVHAWSRQEKTVETVRMPYEDITGIRLYQRLLHGVCTIYGESAQLRLPYNTVSADVMWRFADLVRQSYSGAGSTTLRGTRTCGKRISTFGSITRCGTCGSGGWTSQ